MPTRVNGKTSMTAVACRLTPNILNKIIVKKN